MTRNRTCLAALVALALSSAANAQTSPFTWQPTTSDIWNNPANWLDGTAANFVPVGSATTQLIFNASGTTSYTATNDLGAFTINSMNFNNSGSGIITLAGSDLVLAGVVPTFGVTGAVALQNVISGTGPLSITGTGLLAFSGANTFTGGITVPAMTFVYAGNPVTSGTTPSGGYANGTITSSPVGTGALSLGNSSILTISGGNRVIPNTVTMTGVTATPSVIDVPTGLELTTTGAFNGGTAAVLNKTGNGLLRITFGSQTTASSVGTVNVNGGTLQLADPLAGATGGGDLGATSIVVNSGGNYVFGSFPPLPAENPDLPAATALTINTGGVATYNVIEDAGPVNMAGGVLQMRTSPVGTSGAATWTSGTITSLGGLVPGVNVVDGSQTLTKSGSGTVTITDIDYLATGAVTLGAGTIETNRYISASGALTMGTSTTTGTFRWNPGSGNLSMVLNKGLVLSTGASGGGVMDVANASAFLVFTSTFTGSTRPFTKTGPGTMAIASAAAPAYTGTITINNGMLRINAAAYVCTFAPTATGTLAVDSGAGTTTLGGVALNLTTTGTIQFDVNGAAPTVPLMTLTGTVTKSGTPVLRLTNQVAFTPGTYTLIDYGGTAITAGGITLQSGRHITGGLIFDSVNTRIQVTISSSDTTRWTGALGSTWDVGASPGVGGTNNWQTVAGAAATNFVQTDSVAFTDAAAPNYTVNLGTTVLPAAVNVNADGDYTFQGVGKISGVSPLIKSGNGTLNILNNNDFGGTTTINQGRVQVGNGGATGSIGSINLTMASGTTFGYNRTLPMTIGGLVTTSGAVTIDVGGAGSLIMNSTIIALGTVTKMGSGTLLLGGDSDGAGTFTGLLNIDGGVVQLDDFGANGDLGPSLITVNSGGIFRIGPHGNPDLPAATAIRINPGGEFNPLIGEDFGVMTLAGGTLRITGGPTTSVNNGVSNVLESGSIISETQSTLANTLGNTGTVYTKNTAGTVTITGKLTYEDVPINVEEGTIVFQGQNIPPSGATAMSIGTATLAARIRMLDAAIATMPRPVILGVGGAEVDVVSSGGTLTLSGIVSGAALTKSGPGTLILTNAGNTYSGGTIISAGTLKINAPNIGASGPVSVGSGATLRGNGSVGGPVTVISTGTIRGGDSIGTLTLAAGLDVQPGGSIFVELAAGAAVSSATPGGSTVGAVPNPTSNNFLNVTGLLATISNSATVNVDNSAATFAEFSPYSYQIGKAPNDQTGLNIVLGSQFTFSVPVQPGTASLTGDSSGAIFLNFTSAPEPALLGLASLAGLAAIRRRRA